MPIMVPVSAGELVDKILILRIKAERVEPSKQTNVRKELSMLEETAHSSLPQSEQLASMTGELLDVNIALWEIEDAIRDCERAGDFGPDFVRLARAVYVQNDRRAVVKRSINDLVGSEIVEEKSYRPY